MLVEFTRELESIMDFIEDGKVDYDETLKRLRRDVLNIVQKSE